MEISTKSTKLDGMFSMKLSFGQFIAGIMGAVSLTVTIVLWAFTNFQTKSDAQIYQQETERALSSLQGVVDSRYGTLDKRILSVEANTNQIGKDVSYIRGRLEPKNK